ncbi:hypothetical protein LI291_03790 [Intestinibacillus massiliensis]|nr:hypothetical protein [Intestinibacillus massiliensis]
MQWDKVKNILLVILLVVNGFLLGSLILRQAGTDMQQQALLEDIRVVLRQYGVECGKGLRIPAQRGMLALEIDRSRTAEEAFARAVLEGTVERVEREDGETVFTGDNGSVSWRPDGTVNAAFRQEGAVVPGSARGMEKSASELLAACGVTLKGSRVEADLEAGEAVLTATVGGLPVFNRRLTVSWQGEGQTAVAGQWSFGTPYATTADRERLCSAEAALLQVARGETGQGKVGRIDTIELGYQMDAGAGARLLLSPFWRVETDRGTVFVDALK